MDLKTVGQLSLFQLLFPTSLVLVTIMLDSELAIAHIPYKVSVLLNMIIFIGCVDGGRFIRSFDNNDIQYTPSTTSHNFTMTLADSGNQVALEDALSFTLVVSVTSSSFSGFTVIVLSSPNVIIDDLDGE